MRRISAKFIETLTFVIVFSIPPAILEHGAGMVWWMILFYRAFNACLNAWTLLYSERFGDWLAAFFPTFAKLVSERTGKAISSLMAVLLMQVPLSILFLYGLNRFVPKKEEVFGKPLLITIGLCLVLWSYEHWLCPWCERHIPWLARLMKDPVGTTGTAAKDVVGHVARGGRHIRARIQERGSKPR